ncbi:leucine-rich repeat domain-containing protein [uncultured Paludibaculum sp.]|uniref:leucine-rich repeat domain-containing protein n=1 Tax=uncultured Paludibaculum sp. TaxID=1765020 RepID=UPI002AAAEC6A|nr:leucine-rich repeat domain-containing protein [uncultured Paludibaculum sp.]
MSQPRGGKSGEEIAAERIEEVRKNGAAKLDLSELGLGECPAEVADLIWLQELDLWNNQLTALPDWLGHLTQLQRLYLSTNQLTTLPDWLGHLTQLQRLDLSTNQLTTLPDWLGQLTQLQRLDLSNNQLTALSDWLGQLTQLQWLDLSNNPLTALPDWLGQLTQLQWLYLSNNPLTALPDWLGQLTQLQWLYLSNNPLTALPDCLGQLTQLQGLDLSNNQLTVLPDGLGQLTQLRWLYLSNNQLTALPDWLGQLTQLRWLYLNNNQLTALPDWLGQLTHLLELKLSGNPLSDDLLEAAEQGIARLLDYLRELGESAVEMWQAKVMLVGEGGHGKTCLLRALKGEPFVAGHLPTPLLDVRTLSLRHPTRDGELDLRAWDFGGQDFYFATQQFFFTGKSIFLLVWNPRGDFQRDPLKNWLDRIYALAPDAPVYLVATHGDTQVPRIPLAQLKEEYPNIAGEVFSVDSKSGKNIDLLRDALRRKAASLPHMGVRRPTSWVRATGAIHNHPENYLPVERFRELVKEHGVREVNTFLAQLSLSGEITYFSKNPIYHPETAELNDWVILKPAWLLQRISDVLTDRHTQTTAVFRDQDLGTIWPNLPGYVCGFLARLMEHFDLAYRVGDHSGRRIVVELSPVDRPAAVLPRWSEWVANSAFPKVALHYKFPIAIPPGLPTWFTARAHSYTTPEHHWRGGAFLCDGNGNAGLIETELDHKTVRLEVRGPVPLEFFTKLRICFEDTVNRFPGLKQRLREYVPCAETGCPGFDRKTLELELADGVTEIRCQAPECRRKHRIETLLYGLRPSRQERTLEEILDSVKGLQQEFHLLTARAQSRLDSRCPSLISLEYERLPDILPSVMEGWRNELIDKPVPARLGLYCMHPGSPHHVRSYEIQPPGRRLAELAPLVREAHKILGLALPLIGRKAPNLKDVTEGWSDKLSKPLGMLDETGEETQRVYGTALVALRQILMECAAEEEDRWGGLRQVLLLKSQYLWVCEEHATHPDYQG